MATLTPIEMAVLDTTVRAPENLERIYQRLHEPPAAIPLADAADAVWSLVEKGLLATRPSGDERLPDDLRRLWRAQFEPTPQGREIMADEGPRLPPPGWPEGRVYPGMFRGLIPEIGRDQIDEARREMWGNFPGDVPE